MPSSKWRLESGASQKEIEAMLAKDSLPYKMEAIRLLEEAGRGGNAVWAAQKLFAFVKNPELNDVEGPFATRLESSVDGAIEEIAKDDPEAARIALTEWSSWKDDSPKPSLVFRGRGQRAILSTVEVAARHPQLEEVLMCLDPLLEYLKLAAKADREATETQRTDLAYYGSLIAVGEIGKTNWKMAKRVAPIITEVWDSTQDPQIRGQAAKILTELNFVK